MRIGGLGTRYALMLAALTLAVVTTTLLGAGLLALRQSRVIQQEIRSAIDSARSADEEAALRGAASYLGDRLFNPLYQLDVERLNEEIAHARKWLSVSSLVVVGPVGRVLTDGTDANERYGETLEGPLPSASAPAALLIRRARETEVRFLVRSGEVVAGWGVVTLAEAPWQAALRRLDGRTAALWSSHRTSLLAVGALALAVTLALGLLTSVQLSKTLARPLTEKSRAAGQIASGKLDQSLDLRAPAELGELARALSAMANALRDQEGALRAERADLASRNAELERFTYTVSHDLKSPLVTIRSYASLLEGSFEKGDAARFQADVARVVTASEKMRQLLDDLLELSRIGRVVNPPSAVSLRELALEAAELVKGRLDAGGICVEVAQHLPLVHGDRPRLVEVFQNLFDNAAKFMGDQARPRIEVGVRQDGPQPVFFVRDNGIGIEPEQHERVFGLFDKLDPKSAGTGIGLALVRRIVEAHGGRIWVESLGAGQGATFCFTLHERRDA